MAELALAVVGLAVAVPTLVEPVVRSIRFIRETLHKYKTVDLVQSRLVLQLDLHLVQIENLAIFLYSENNTPGAAAPSTIIGSSSAPSPGGPADSLDPTSRAVLNRVIAVLDCLLQDFVVQLSTALDISGGRVRGHIRRLVFSFRGRSGDPLQQLLRELESWERSFGNVVFSACLAAGRKLPVALSGTLPANGPAPSYSSSVLPAENSPQAKPARMADLAELLQQCCVLKPSPDAPPLRLFPLSREGFQPLEHTSLLFGKDQDQKDGTNASCFLEMHLPDNDDARADADLRNIAAFLRGANPRLVALLPCLGFFVEKDGLVRPGMEALGCSTRALVFQVPEGLSSPRSLRSVLLEARSLGIKHPLDERLRLMKKLASAVLFIHTADHIHKSIRADNVILLKETNGSVKMDHCDPRESLGEPFLVGFDYSRHDSGHSEMQPKTIDVHKIYYLPVARQGDPTRRYTMLDDVYSLGVLLLEIAIWRSLVKFEPDPITPFINGRPNGEWVATRSMLGPRGCPLHHQALHKRLLNIAKKEVARTMGSAVSGLVVACLTCLDETVDQDEAVWTSFGRKDDLADKDGIVVGLAYIKKVIMALDTVSL